jgi:hypothetical protein
MIIRAATTRGLLHQATGTLRQDTFALTRCRVPGEMDRAVAVVCDGVGEFGRSDEAAALVSHSLANLGADAVPWRQAFARANEQLRKVAAEALASDAADPGDDGMATTAVAVTVRREKGEWAGAAAWVGDSTLWHLNASGRWKLLTGPAEDVTTAEYHSTAVTPLPSADGGCSCLDFRVGGGALFVMTDGVANPLKWSRDVQETLAAWWTRPPDPISFAAQVSFARKTHLDDRTVIGIWPDGSDADAGAEG